MNIALMRLRPIAKELRGIRTALERLADYEEVRLSMEGYNIRPPKVDTSGPEPTVDYVDEELDWAHEEIGHIRREDERRTKEEMGD